MVNNYVAVLESYMIPAEEGLSKKPDTIDYKATLPMQEIGKIIMDYIPKKIYGKWEKIVVCVNATSNSMKCSLYINIDGKFIEYSYPDVTKMKIDIINTLRKYQLAQKWSVFTFIMNSQLSFKSYIDYDIEEKDFNKYFKNWSEKYLV